jgi:hydrogenase expression/formation protein HypE
VVTEGLSPLFVSIHATDPEVRARMLRNRRGATSLRWLRALLDAGVEVHCLRDLTRGGLASALNEIAAAAAVAMTIDERQVPVREDVRGACELLGFDPMYVANEGRFVAFVPEREATRALDVLQRHPVSAGATVAGHVTTGRAGAVSVRSSIGSMRVLDMLSGEQLPRIC